MKTALITGSSQGLGLAVASAFDKRKIKVLLTGRSYQKLERCLTDFLHKDLHDPIACDLTDHTKLLQLLFQLDAKDIVPDIIIHNLGGKVDGDTQPLTANILQQSIKLNLGVAAQINEHFLPSMVRRGHGRIIHVSSDASLTGQSAPGYAAAKAAVNGYVKSTARFYASHNIMICAVLPSVIEHEDSAWTEKKLTQPEYYQKKIDAMPLGRFSFPFEIADVIADIACCSNMVYAGSLIELTTGL